MLQTWTVTEMHMDSMMDMFCSHPIEKGWITCAEWGIVGKYEVHTMELESFRCELRWNLSNI